MRLVIWDLLHIWPFARCHSDQYFPHIHPCIKKKEKIRICETKFCTQTKAKSRMQMYHSMAAPGSESPTSRWQSCFKEIKALTRHRNIVWCNVIINPHVFWRGFSPVYIIFWSRRFRVLSKSLWWDVAKVPSFCQMLSEGWIAGKVIPFDYSKIWNLTEANKQTFIYQFS